MPILHFGYLPVSILFSKSGEIWIAAAIVSILSFEIMQHPGCTASRIKNLASVQAAAAGQRENKAGLQYRLWRFAAIHHCRGFSPGSTFLGNSANDHYSSMNGAMMYPREVCFSLSPYFATLADSAGRSFSANAKAHSIKQSRHS